MISRLDSNLQLSQSTTQTDYNIKSTKLKMQGLREDTDEMRDVMAEFLKANITAVKDAIAQIEYEQKDVVDQRFGGNEALASNDPVWKELEQKRQELLSSQTQYESQQIDNQMTAVQQITNDNERKAQNIKSASSKAVSELLSGGTRSDSVKVLEAQSVQMRQLRDLTGTEIAEYNRQLIENSALKSNIVDGGKC
jgi:hypothetical protein